MEPDRLSEAWDAMCRRSKERGWPPDESYERNAKAWRDFLAKMKKDGGKETKPVPA